MIKTIVLCLLLSIGTYVVISPVLQSGLYSDDETMSLQRARIEFENQNAYDYYRGMTKTVLFNVKRTYIFYAYFIFPYILSNTFIYKITVLTVVIINILLLAYFVNLLLDSKYLGFLVASFLPMLIQFRLFHDPILSFYLSQQMLMISLLLTLTNLVLYAKYNKLIFYLLSCLFFFISIFSYEVSYLYIFPILLVILTRISHFRVKQTFKIITPYIIIICLGLILTYFIQNNSSGQYGGNYSGVKPSFIPTQIAKTFFIQASSTLPLSYHFGTHSQLFCHTLTCLYQRFQWTDILVLLTTTTILILLVTEKKHQKDNIYTLLLIGILLMFIPVPLISLSQGYQRILTNHGFGIGYITVYLQYFGLAIIIGSVIMLINQIQTRYIKTTLYAVVLFGVFIATSITSQDNRIVVAKMNTILHTRRLFLEKALRDGILNNISPDTPILFEDSYRYDPYPVSTEVTSWISGYPWKSKYFVYSITNKRYNVFTNFQEFDLHPSPNKIIVNLYNCPSETAPQQACITLLSEDNQNHLNNQSLDILYNGTTKDLYKKMNTMIYN